jgi:hypothetical protein
MAAIASPTIRGRLLKRSAAQQNASRNVWCHTDRHRNTPEFREYFENSPLCAAKKPVARVLLHAFLA